MTCSGENRKAGEKISPVASLFFIVCKNLPPRHTVNSVDAYKPGPVCIPEDQSRRCVSRVGGKTNGVRGAHLSSLRVNSEIDQKRVLDHSSLEP